MLNRIKLIILYLIISTQCFSQEKDIRVYAGWNILQIYNNSEELINGVIHKTTYSGRPGFQFGTAVSFGNKLFIQPAIQYILLSTKTITENTANSTIYIDETKLNIVSIPIKMGIKIPISKNEDIFGLRVFCGLNSQYAVYINHFKKSNIINAPTYSSFILNADTGLTLDIFFLFIEFGYQMGLTPIQPSISTGSNSNFYTNFGFKLNI